MTETNKQAFAPLDEENVFRIVYQPVVDMNTGALFSYEALLRSNVPMFTSPPQMINAALSAGRLGEFGRRLRERTIADAPAGAVLFINIHPAELGEGWLVRPDDPIFSREEHVYLEITESVPLTHFDLCHSILKEVRTRDIRLAVDDLGSGYSNLKYIDDLAPEIVKLDRNLIVDIDRSKRQQILFKAIVRLCHDLGATVVAEGVETMAEFEVTRDAGADLIQGYLVAYPSYPAPSYHWPPADPPGLKEPQGLKTPPGPKQS